MQLDWALAAAIIIILIGAMIQGMVGFGFSQFALPLLVLFMLFDELIPIMVVLSLFLNIMMIRDLRKDVQVRRIWPLMLGGVFGIPIGTYLLLVANPNHLKVLIGFLILVFGLAQLFNIRKRLKNERAAMGPIGFTGGVLQGSVTMSGPPLILFFSNQGFTKQEFRASLVAFFLFMNLATLPFFLYAGRLTGAVLESSLILLPGLAIGTFAGAKLAHKIDEESFKKGVIVLVMIFGCMSVASGLNLLPSL
jgi:uncharacterized membrane protein YfcA